LIPAINAIITKWLPNHEKSTSAAIFTSGNQLSGIFGLPIAAAFCASDWKWPAVFYTAALLGTIWLIVWRTTVKNSPHKTSLITDKEKAYLERVVEMNRPHRVSLFIQVVEKKNANFDKK
jgi:MFS family permease